MKFGNKLFSTAAATLLLPAGFAQAQTTYNVGGGTVTYTGPAPSINGTNSYI